MDVKATFASRLKELRGTMKQEDFGAKIGVSRGSISYYENGTRTADIEILDKLCREYKVSADWLLGLSNVRSSNADLRAFSEQSGLDEESIEILNKINKGAMNSDGNIMRILNRIMRYYPFPSWLKSLAEYMEAMKAKHIWESLWEKYFFDYEKEELKEVSQEEGKKLKISLLDDFHKVKELKKDEFRFVESLDAVKILDDIVNSDNALGHKLFSGLEFELTDIHQLQVNEYQNTMLFLVKAMAEEDIESLKNELMSEGVLDGKHTEG